MKANDRQKLIELLTEARVEVAAARHEIDGCKKKRNGVIVPAPSTDQRAIVFLSPAEKH
jgi:hypothetical protein